MKNKSNIGISLLCIVLFSLSTIAQKNNNTLTGNTAKPAFTEAMVKSLIDEMKKNGIAESEYEGYIKFKKAEFEGMQNGTWEVPYVYKTAQVDSPVVVGCVNSDFADSTFNSWAAKTGCHPIAVSSSGCGGITACCPTPGFITGRHDIITTNGLDPVGNFSLIPTGRQVVMRLGNNLVGAQAEELSKSFIVDPNSTGFTYWYAVVLQDAGHPASQQPAFEIIMFDDATGDTIPCSYYYVAAGAGIPGFQTVGQVVYKTWSTVTLDLNNYLGKQVTIRFRTFDCSQTGHYGYAYISGDCFKSEIADPYFCDGWNPDTTMDLSAPAGYSSYLWLKNGTDSITNTQNINIKNPKLGDQYTVILTPYHTGSDSCGISLGYQIKRKAHPDSEIPDYSPKQNVFTPNQDKINDKFVTHDFDWIAKFNIKIYDRWGKLMFQSDDPYIEWDGQTLNGNTKADDGVYYWHSTYVSGCYPNADEPGYKEYKTHGFLHLFSEKNNN